MMESILRRFYREGQKDRWATDLALKPDETEVSELPRRSTEMLTTRASGSHASNDLDMRDYYRGLISSAISQGGDCQGQRISIPWLRMTLAGLEMRPIPPEAMWEGTSDEMALMPGYDRLFPTEGTPR